MNMILHGSEHIPEVCLKRLQYLVKDTTLVDIQMELLEV